MSLYNNLPQGNHIVDVGDGSEAVSSPLQQMALPGLWPEESPPFEGPFIPHIPEPLRYPHAQSLARDAAAAAARRRKPRLEHPLAQTPPEVAKRAPRLRKGS